VRRRILLARDRLGVKPLYYYSDGRFLAFASEIKALLDVPGIPRELDAEALDLYLLAPLCTGPANDVQEHFRGSSPDMF
jgi:asparagine synthase (glutamine-hydrolysing)